MKDSHSKVHALIVNGCRSFVELRICQGCEALVDEFAQNAQGLILCRSCSWDFEILQLFWVQRGTLFDRWKCQPHYPQILPCSFGLGMFRFVTLNEFRPWERLRKADFWYSCRLPSLNMDLRTHRDNLLQGLRREDEELLRPSKEEQEGCCGVEVCGRLLAHLAIWQIQFINWSECNFFFQRGKIQKKMSCSFKDALCVPCRFGTTGQSARQCFMEILEARGTTCKDSRLDATWAKSNGWRWLVNIWWFTWFDSL